VYCELLLSDFHAILLVDAGSGDTTNDDLDGWPCKIPEASISFHCSQVGRGENPPLKFIAMSMLFGHIAGGRCRM
jgi:hypothetical protein